MRSYKLTDQAEQDLNEIWDFIAADNPSAADSLIDKFFESMDSLAEMPAMGRERPDLTDAPVRFWVVRSYLIVYTLAEPSIEVLRVLSGYRDIASIIL